MPTGRRALNITQVERSPYHIIGDGFRDINHFLLFLIVFVSKAPQNATTRFTSNPIEILHWLKFLHHLERIYKAISVGLRPL